MMKTKNLYKRGYTIVELLVVIGIIATVAAISIPIGLRVVTNMRSADSRATMKNMNLAFKQFASDHGSVTNGMTDDDGTGVAWTGNDTNTVGHSSNSHWRFYNALDGAIRASDQKVYTKTKKKYLEGVSTSKNNERNGLWRHTDDNRAEGLIDPWGFPYRQQIDFDGDGEIAVVAGLGRDGQTAQLGSDIVYFVSRGPDGEFGTDDDVTSHLSK